MEANERVVRGVFESFSRGDAASAREAWAPDGVWHGLDAGPLRLDLVRDDYFEMLGRWAAGVRDYRFELRMCEACGPALVVVHLDSSGTTAQGPLPEGGGVMVFRLDGGQIVECWTVSRGAAADGRGF